MIFNGVKKINYFNEYDNKIDVAIVQPNIDPNLKGYPKIKEMLLII